MGLLFDEFHSEHAIHFGLSAKNTISSMILFGIMIVQEFNQKEIWLPI